MESMQTVNGSRLEVAPTWLARGNPHELCPVSATPGHKVKQVTLGNHVLPDHWRFVWQEGFHFCPHATCRVVYYNNVVGAYITQEEMRTRVGIKSGPSPTPVCYCMSVTEEQIFEEIQVKRCCDSLEDIKEYTKARTGRLCHVTNPAGRCCGKHVSSVVEKALSSMPDRQIEQRARNICCQIPDE